MVHTRPSVKKGGAEGPHGHEIRLDVRCQGGVFSHTSPAPWAEGVKVKEEVEGVSEEAVDKPGLEL